MSENRAHRLRRLIYRSSYTGMRETDRILGAFARGCLGHMTDAELNAYEDLLAQGDPAIWAWLSQHEPIPANMRNPALERLLAWVEANPL